MESLINRIKKLAKIKTDEEKEEDNFKSELINTIRETEIELKNAYDKFNFANNPDEIEACIYNIKAIESRYEMLVKRAKKNKIQCTYQETLSLERKDALLNE